MEAKLSDDRMKARLELVAEHIRRENLHELDGNPRHISGQKPGTTTSLGRTIAWVVIRFASTICKCSPPRPISTSK